MEYEFEDVDRKWEDISWICDIYNVVVDGLVIRDRR